VRPAHRAKFFGDARGSAFECAACLDASVAEGFILPERIGPGKEMLARAVAMLTRFSHPEGLIARSLSRRARPCPRPLVLGLGIEVI
jgi:hypothetical protein